MLETRLEFISAQSGHVAIMTDSPLAASQRKLVLVVVDALRCDMLLRAIEAGDEERAELTMRLHVREFSDLEMAPRDEIGGR